MATPIQFSIGPHSPSPSLGTSDILGPNDSISRVGTPRTPSHASQPSHCPLPCSSSSSVVGYSAHSALCDPGLLQPWSADRVERFKFLIGALTADAGFALRWVDTYFARKLFTEFIPMAPRVTRHALSRNILPSMRTNMREEVPYFITFEYEFTTNYLLALSRAICQRKERYTPE